MRRSLEEAQERGLPGPIWGDLENDDYVPTNARHVSVQDSHLLPWPLRCTRLVTFPGVSVTAPPSPDDNHGMILPDTSTRRGLLNGVFIQNVAKKTNGRNGSDGENGQLLTMISPISPQVRRSPRVQW